MILLNLSQPMKCVNRKGVTPTNFDASQKVNNQADGQHLQLPTQPQPQPTQPQQHRRQQQQQQR